MYFPELDEKGCLKSQYVCKRAYRYVLLMLVTYYAWLLEISLIRDVYEPHLV